MKKLFYSVLMIITLVFPTSTGYAKEPLEEIILPESFIMETVVDGIPSAGAVAFAPNGLVYLASKHGVVLTYQNGKLNPEPFIDISAEVNSYWDRGLLGIAIHPQFPEKPYIYLLYTYDPPGAELDGQGSRVNRLIRVNADPANLTRSVPSSKVVILGKNSTYENLGDEKNSATVDNPACFDNVKKTYIEDCLPSDSPSHSIGTVMFGMDGSLFVGIGEGSNFMFIDKRAARAQDLNALSGKILRIDPETGSGLPDNPFYSGNLNDNRSRVWDYGLRNPFRFSQNPETGELIIGDVGWDTWEEINYGKGKNFGWPCFEGSNTGNRPQPGFQSNPDFDSLCQPLYPSGNNSVTPPMFSYPTGAGGAVVAGPIYAGTSYPEEYHGVLFYGDFDRRVIKYLHQETDGTYQSHDFASGLIAAGGPVQLLSGPDDDIYCVIYNKETDTSKLVRFVYDPGGKKNGRIAILGSPIEGKIPLNVEFRITSTNLGPEDLANLAWTFGDGTTGKGANVIHSYAQSGVFKIRASVAKSPVSVFSNEIIVNAGNSSPIPEILSPSENYLYKTGDRIDLVGAATDPEDGTIPPPQLKWNVILHHKSHVHTDFFHATGRTASIVIPDHGDKVWLELCLTASDSKKLEKKVCRPVMPKTTTINFESEPPGMTVVYEGESKATPFEETPVTNSMVETETLQNQYCMKFDHWSDGGPRSHLTLVGDTNLILKAFYKSGLPPEWKTGEIGLNPDGNGCLQNGDMVIWPSRIGLQDDTDNLTFIHTIRTDDFSLKTEIPVEKERLSPRLSGFLIRETLAPDSPSLFMGWNGERQLQILNRNNTKKYQQAIIKSLPIQPWQQIIKNGDKFIWSQSTDGIKWDQIVAVTFPTTQPLLVGLAVFDPTGEAFGPVEFNNTGITTFHP